MATPEGHQPLGFQDAATGDKSSRTRWASSSRCTCGARTASLPSSARSPSSSSAARPWRSLQPRGHSRSHSAWPDLQVPCPASHRLGARPASPAPQGSGMTDRHAGTYVGLPAGVASTLPTRRPHASRSLVCGRRPPARAPHLVK
nr:uncharacterized protein LOC129529605 isoform X1 [Gorilla gorilla gorilla]